MQLFMAILVSLLLSACSGYKPAPVYANEVFEEPVIIKVKIDPEDPSAGVYLQDTIAQLAVTRLNLAVTENVHEAKNYIVVNSYAINTSPINTDENGNVIRYSVNAAIKFAIKDKMGFWSKNIVANEYVNVPAQTTLGSTQKEKAARVAINKALDSFVVAVMERSKKFKAEKAAVMQKEKELKRDEDKNKQPQTSIETQSVDVESKESIAQEPTIQSSESQNSSSEIITPLESESVTVDGASSENIDPIPSKEETIFSGEELQEPLVQTNI